MVDQTGAPQQIIADDRMIFIVDIAGDLDGVVTQATDDRGDNVLTGALYVDAVIAFQRIQLDAFDIVESHVQPGAEDTLTGNHEVIVERRTQHHDFVEPGAAVDADRRVDGVIDGIRTATAVDLCIALLNHTFVIVRQIDGHKGPDDKGVVIGLALQTQGALIVIDVEGVFAGAAKYGGGLADAVTHISNTVQCQPQGFLVVHGILDSGKRLRIDFIQHRIERSRVKNNRVGIRVPDQADDDCRGVGVEGILRINAGISITRCTKDLANLEDVITRAPVQRSNRAIIIRDNFVVTCQAINN